MHPTLDWKFAWICTFGTRIGRQTDPSPFADRIEFLVDIKHLQSTKRSFSALRGMSDGRQTFICGPRLGSSLSDGDVLLSSILEECSTPSKAVIEY
jgi:hypothetical protein